MSKSLLLPVLPQYLSAFVAVLGSGREEDVDPGLRKEVIMTLCSLLRAFPRALQADLITMVTPVWNILLKETPLYPSSGTPPIAINFEALKVYFCL